MHCKLSTCHSLALQVKHVSFTCAVLSHGAALQIKHVSFTCAVLACVHADRQGLPGLLHPRLPGLRQGMGIHAHTQACSIIYMHVDVFVAPHMLDVIVQPVCMLYQTYTYKCVYMPTYMYVCGYVCACGCLCVSWERVHACVHLSVMCRRVYMFS